MRSQSALRISIAALAVCLLVAASPAMASEPQDTKPCTNRTLKGDYGYTTQGVLINIPGLPPEAQFRSLGVAHFDGRGHLTWVEHTVVNGVLVQPDGAEASGTYTVNSDCTGTAVINTPNSFAPLRLDLVVVKQGREFHTQLQSSAISSVFIKVQ